MEVSWPGPLHVRCGGLDLSLHSRCILCGDPLARVEWAVDYTHKHACFRQGRRGQGRPWSVGPSSGLQFGTVYPRVVNRQSSSIAKYPGPDSRKATWGAACLAQPALNLISHLFIIPDHPTTYHPHCSYAGHSRSLQSDPPQMTARTRGLRDWGGSWPSPIA
ncbi:hypothetical protein TSOC_005771 [Tetrabaena socialis]|uniref:Uncharacterized protein n=1 Tax=Tetrabaena socialis TaxID=47790 RepID=A0A2J8A5H5_9CHLO|nr:hypothetical protein TSOC_005771 [Tetrabaena socialis]|eukprot:PNH07747.1 hypothetical protein TSOC_005771 [Tetrabaena socialis]